MIAIIKVVFNYVMHTLSISIPLLFVYIITRFLYKKYHQTKIDNKAEVLHYISVFYFLCLYFYCVLCVLLPPLCKVDDIPVSLSFP